MLIIFQFDDRSHHEQEIQLDRSGSGQSRKLSLCCQRDLESELLLRMITEDAETKRLQYIPGDLMKILLTARQGAGIAMPGRS